MTIMLRRLPAETDSIQEGRAEGRAESVVVGVLKALKNLMKNSGVTIDEAMSMLGVSEVERFQYVEMLKQ